MSPLSIPSLCRTAADIHKERITREQFGTTSDGYYGNITVSFEIDASWLGENNDFYLEVRTKKKNTTQRVVFFFLARPKGLEPLTS